MKCIEYANGKMARVRDYDAEKAVNKGKATYTTKAAWKRWRAEKAEKGAK